MLGGTGLESGEAKRDLLLEPFRAAGVGVNADTLPGRATQEFVDRDAQRLAFDVPQGLIDAAERACQDRPASVKRMTVDCLPVVYHLPWVLADQVRLDLLDRL